MCGFKDHSLVLQKKKTRRERKVVCPSWKTDSQKRDGASGICVWPFFSFVSKTHLQQKWAFEWHSLRGGNAVFVLRPCSEVIKTWGVVTLLLWTCAAPPAEDLSWVVQTAKLPKMPCGTQRNISSVLHAGKKNTVKAVLLAPVWGAAHKPWVATADRNFAGQFSLFGCFPQTIFS